MRRRYRIDAAGNLVEILSTNDLPDISVCHFQSLEEMVRGLPVGALGVIPLFPGSVIIRMSSSWEHVVDLAEHVHVERRVPELRSGESDHPGATEAIENLEHVLVDIAKHGNKDDFYFLARANGITDEELDELWQGTRRRLKLAL